MASDAAQAGSAPRPGGVCRLAPGIRRVVAPNPSPMTLWGTNTYLIGTGGVAVIDPGPDDPRHLAALCAALGPGERITHVLVTHSHLDHTPLAARLSRETGAPVLGFGATGDGRSPVMRALAANGLSDGGEGADMAFSPDDRLRDGDMVQGGGWSLTAIWTPGHMSNHLCFALDDRIFTGDHVMGWASSLISPPDGDMGAYMESLERLQERGAAAFYPGHGAPVEAPQTRIAELRAHRRAREQQILDALAHGPADAMDLAQRLYTDTAANLLPAARRNVFAHLIDLAARGEVLPSEPTSADVTFRLKS